MQRFSDFFSKNTKERPHNPEPASRQSRLWSLLYLEMCHVGSALVQPCQHHCLAAMTN